MQVKVEVGNCLGSGEGAKEKFGGRGRGGQDATSKIPCLKMTRNSASEDSPNPSFHCCLQFTMFISLYISISLELLFFRFGKSFK